MATEDFHRKLTAILSADVQGYSRLMGDDEEATVRTLTAYRELMISLIQSHRGHVVDTPGDNILAKFDSGTDAVRCAVEIQEELRIRNADLPENRRMLFRIGINLGDVIEEGDRIYGDGINVAARIEGLAEGGGICISGFVYGTIKNKLSLSYEFMGEHSVKNIKDPVRVYRIRMEPEAEAPKVKEKESEVRTWPRVALPVVVICILGAFAVWYFSFRQAPVVSDIEKAPKTIAVLPFADLSPDKDQEYFVDGLSEEIINYLAQIPDLTVIARTSSFSFKGTTKKIQEIGSDLGIAHILEGSVRKAGNALRITAQLIRVVDGSHVWSKTYDKEFKVEEMFSVQKDIATAVANELKVTFSVGESLKQLGGTDNVEAYELYLVAQSGLYDDTQRVIKTIDEAISIDPKFALAWVAKANHQAIFGAMQSPSNQVASEFNKALTAVRKAIEIEPNLPEAYASLGSIKSARGDWIEAEQAYSKAFELAGSPIMLEVYSIHQFAVGYFEKANKNLKKALRSDPMNHGVRINYITSYALLGDKQQLEREIEHTNELFGNRAFSTTITLAHLGMGDYIPKDDISAIFKDYGNLEIDLHYPEKGIRELKRFLGDNIDLSADCLNSAALLSANLGDHELTMKIIEKLATESPNSIFFAWLPVMHEMRQFPRFKEFVREIGLVDYWEQLGWPDFCHQTDDGDFECD